MKEKGVSNIVAVVFLILLTVVLITTLWTFVLPIVQDSIASGKVCQEALSSVYIDAVCKSETTLFVSIARGPDNVELANIQLGILGKLGKIKTINLVEEGGTFEFEDLPGINEKVLYERGTDPHHPEANSQIGIAPIIKRGNTEHLCQMSPLVVVGDCADQ